MKSLCSLSVATATLFFVLFSGVAQAQAPDFVYEVRTDDGYGGPNPTWTLDTGSIGGTVTDTKGGGINQTADYGGGSGTYTLEADQDGTGTITGTGGTWGAKWSVKAYVKGLKTVDLGSSTSASVSYSGNSNSNRSAYFGSIPFGSSDLQISLASGTGSDSDSTSGSGTFEFRPGCSGGTSKTFTEYPGETYYLIKQVNFSASTVIGGYYNGDINAQGSVALSPSLGTDSPEAVLDGPLVSGSPKPSPDYNDTVQYNNDSYDPDDTDSMTALEGICAASWVITAPDGTETTSSSLSGMSFAANQQGLWVVELTVTDNEGAQDYTSDSFEVGDPHLQEPGDGGSCPFSDPHVKAATDPSTGNAHTGMEAPSLSNDGVFTPRVYNNSQTNHPSLTRALGNFSHNFGMAVVQAQGLNDAGTRWYLVDSDGAEWNYGSTGSAPTPPDGAFSTLTQLGGGDFELTDAGPPSSIHRSGQWNYEFNSSGQITKIIRPSQTEITMTYNGSNQLTNVTDSSNNKDIDYTYNGSGYISEIDVNGSSTMKFTYTSDRVTKIELEDILSADVRVVDITYNTDGLIETVKKDGDTDTTVTYDYTKGAGDVPLANISHADGSTNYDYTGSPTATGASFRVTHTNAKSQDTTYDYDDEGNLLEKKTPTPQGAGSGITYTYAYNSDNDVVTASNGVTTYIYTYNASGFVTKIEDQNSRYRSFTYSGVKLTATADNIGTTRSFTYGSGSLPYSPTVVTDGDGDDWTYTYNTRGQVTQITPPTGSQLGNTTFAYDNTGTSPTFGMLASVTNGASDVVTFDDYDDLGNLISVTTNPVGATYNTTEFTFDGASRLVEIEYDDAESVSYTYTGKDLTSVSDEAATTTSYEYCPACSKKTGQTEPLSRSMSWELDSDFATTTFEDPGTNETDFVYDNAKFLKEIVFPDGRKYQFTTDQYGRRKTTKYPNSNVGTFTYDTSGRATKHDFSGTNDDIDYTYFDDGRINTITDRNGTTTYAYTDDRQVESVSYNYSPRGVSNIQKLEYTYYPDGLLESMTWKNAATTVATWDYDYDGAGRLTDVSTSFSETLEYVYDGEGKITEQINGNGTSTEYQYYEARDWVTQIKHFQSTTAFEQFDMEYDGTSNTVGNITNVTELDSSEIDYTYDALYRLTEEDRTGTGSYNDTYTYDVSGNITQVDGSSFATYDSNNQFSTVTSGAFTLNTNGDIGQIGVPPYGCLGLNYDSHGRVTQLKECSGANTTNYIWDGHGRRSYRSGILTIFSGDKIVGELTNGGTIKRAYTWGPDGLAVMRDISGSQSYYYHYGPQGETRHLTNSSATVTDSYRYTAYGQTLYTSGSTENYHKYGGKYGYYTQGALGTILAGARVYYPNARRWVQKDPILFDGGVNVFEYVKGNPVRYVDPDGLEAKNTSDGPVFVKPEEGPIGILPPHSTMPGSVDGVCRYPEGTPCKKFFGKSWLPDCDITIDGPSENDAKCTSGPCWFLPTPIYNADDLDGGWHASPSSPKLPHNKHVPDEPR